MNQIKQNIQALLKMQRQTYTNDFIMIMMTNLLWLELGGGKKKIEFTLFLDIYMYFCNVYQHS